MTYDIIMKISRSVKILEKYFENVIIKEQALFRSKDQQDIFIQIVKNKRKALHYNIY